MGYTFLLLFEFSFSLERAFLHAFSLLLRLCPQWGIPAALSICYSCTSGSASPYRTFLAFISILILNLPCTLQIILILLSNFLLPPPLAYSLHLQV